MPPSRIRVLVLGAQSSLRPAVAAAALADALGDQVLVLAVTGDPAADTAAASRVVEREVQVAVLVIGLAGAPATGLPPGFDLVVVVDAAPTEFAAAGTAVAPALATGGAYVVVWPGPEPLAEPAAIRMAFDEFRERVAALGSQGVLTLLRTRKARQSGGHQAPPPPPPPPPPAAATNFHGLVGNSAAMQALAKTVRKAGRLAAPALILGETGTGKELVARAVHAESARARKPFLAVNCAALPHEMVESELFGHRRGAFTGAHGNRSGQFLAADGGTLLLDEIGDLPMAVQAKLLRVLETREVRAVGADTSVVVDVRVLAATHKDLLAGVRAGWFREDLYYRLAVAVLRVPPLRDHIEDLPHIAEHILDGLRRQTQRPYEGISPETLHAWSQFAWPGNVRQLQNLVTGAALHASGLELPTGHLLPDALPPAPPQLEGVRPRHPRTGERKLDVSGVRAALVLARGNRSRASAALGVSRATLYRFLAEHPAADPFEGPWPDP